MMVKLGDVCEKKIETVKTTYTGKIDYIDISSVDNQRKEITQTQSMLFEDAPSRAKQQVFPGDILVSTVRPNLNAVALITEHSDNILVASTGYCVLRCLPNVHTKYIFHFCQSPAFIEKLVMQAAGASYPAVTSNIVKECVIPLPPLTEQRKIAAVLDKVSDLIAKRRQQLDKLDLLIKARFVEMFGDPEQNPMGWPTIEIGAVITTIESGWSGNGKQREKKADEIAVLKVSSVTKGYFIPEECKVLDDQKNIKKYVSPQRGDLLFSRANTKEMVGATAIIREDYPDLILPDKLWKIHFTDVTNVVYMKYILSSKTIRNKFSATSTGTSGSMYNVSMEKFKAIKIPIPEIQKQNQFSVFVEQTEKTKTTISHSLEKLETLKKALMQEYFG